MCILASPILKCIHSTINILREVHKNTSELEEREQSIDYGSILKNLNGILYINLSQQFK